jgi:hypothetical protein
MTNLHNYFFAFIEVSFGVQKLVAIMETKGNKILKNLKMRWMSMLDLLKKIMSEYKPLLVIMQAYQTFIQMAKVSVDKPFQCFLSILNFLLLSCNQILQTIFQL